MTRTHRRRFLQDLAHGSLAAAAAVTLPRAAHAATAKEKPASGKGDRPNILLILADDLGWADLSCYGSTYHESPVLDHLATEGMRFTNAYAACPVCSPTRASLMTGRYPATVGVTDFIPGHWRPWEKLIVPKIHNELPLAEQTIPELLKPRGYRSICIGKWHLGWGKQFSPAAQGFDETVAGGKNLGDKRVTTYTNAAIDFLKRNKDRPFFLYLSHHSVHIPLEAPKSLVDKYRRKLKPGQKFPQQANPTYAAMVEHLDRETGRLLKAVDDLGLRDNTLVIFYSDNGGLKCIYTGKGEIVTSNAPLRDEKGSLYEGGIREPLIVRWPGKVKPGSVSHEVVTTPDLLPTFLAVAGAAGPKAKMDGVDLTPVLTGHGKLAPRAVYWHYPHYHHTTPAGAVRCGKWKLIEYFDDGRLELYDLEADLGEKTNLAAKLPAKVAELQKDLAAWRKSVGALMPTKNPDYDPAKAHLWRPRRRPRAKPKRKPAPKKKP